MTSVPPLAWQNGAIIPIDQCLLHARSQGAFWGANAFEGVRAYRRADGSYALFRLDDHLARLDRSMRSLHMSCAHSIAELRQACVDLVVANACGTDLHICVVGYFDVAPNFDSLNHTANCGVHITVIAPSRSSQYERGLDVGVSSWRRISDDSMPPRIKTGANYHNSRLAHQEAVRNGFDTALILNAQGKVSEAPTSCLVMLRDGCLVTPPGTAGVLEGLTVDTIATVAAEDLDLGFVKRDIDRTELYAADEIMLCGTLAEIQPVVSVDRVLIGNGRPGPVTRSLQAAYERQVREGARHPDWTTVVPVCERDEVPA